VLRVILSVAQVIHSFRLIHLFTCYVSKLVDGLVVMYNLGVLHETIRDLERALDLDKGKYDIRAVLGSHSVGYLLHRYVCVTGYRLKLFNIIRSSRK